jgi:threonine/homoserine/homoserine lactone efflux protein
MDLLGLVAFVAAYALAVASPGPGVAMAIARGLGRGTKGASAFIAGYVVGDLIWFACAALGLAIIAKTYAPLFMVIKYAGAAYLLFLAWKMWTARAEPLDAPTAPDESPVRLFLGSLALTLGNPKVMVFFVAILPTVVDLETLSLLGFIEIAMLIVVVLSLVLFGYVLLAARARDFVRSGTAMKRVNRICGGALAAAAVAVATR